MQHDGKPTFSSWWRRLQILASEKDFKLGDRASYREYFDDGDDPDTVLDLEISHTEGK